MYIYSSLFIEKVITVYVLARIQKKTSATLHVIFQLTSTQDK